MSIKIACVDDGPIVNRINAPNVNNTFMTKLKCGGKKKLKLISNDENNSIFVFHHLKSNNYKIISEKSHSSKVF